jgi:serine/threonine protein kinase/tetratricopeptide (TPR) repeat protein
MALTFEQMTRLNRLLDEALELDEPARRRWLEDLDPTHADLRVVLEKSLLDGWSSDQTLPKIDFRGIGSGSLFPTNDLKSGERIGPYELVRPLGAGGMAEVWLARRADGAFQREVALKLPMIGGLRRDLERRFVHERDILACLEHVNIARFYDAGVSAEGLPFLALEFVPGQPITQWCDSQNLDVAARLRLFLQVLGAVHYAHKRQVVHRDIKPSNILVTNEGQVRLLDFGVAKMLEQNDATQLTQIYGRALTPDYASPEHLMGEAVGTLSDVYSLGVVLYELLAGQRPYKLKSRTSSVELERAIVDAQIQRPSTQGLDSAAATRSSSPARLVSALRGDIDAIVLKALEREPARRYASVQDLADDLRRHLEGQPVRAKPPSLLYRGSKLARRHRLGLSMALATSLAVALLVLALNQRNPAATAAASGFTPPPHSVAVLPFANMSGDPKQDYFSDGLSEELLNSLAHISDLQVAARTSSFSFKGKETKIADIGRALNVGAVLEGSVRRDASRVRITAQLINAVTGFHLWSETYDRELKDVLGLQVEIAGAVTRALKATLLPEAQAAIEVGGTHDPKALDAYLRGRSHLNLSKSPDGASQRIAEYEEAVRIDPGFAKAYARLGDALEFYAWNLANEKELPAIKSRARIAAERAVELAPTLAEAHAVLGTLLGDGYLDFAGQSRELEKAVEFAPREPSVLVRTGRYFVDTGIKTEEGLAQIRLATTLDPLNVSTWMAYAYALQNLGRYSESIEAANRALNLNPADQFARVNRGLSEWSLGQWDAARKDCEDPKPMWMNHLCLALLYPKLGRKADARANLAAFQAEMGRSAAYQYAEIYAQWGDHRQAVHWLEEAYRLPDPGIVGIRMDPLLAPIADEPGFKSIVAKLRFPR